MLSPDDIARFDETGYLVLRSRLATPSLAAVAGELAAWQERIVTPDGRNLRFRLKNRVPDGALVLDAIDPVLDLLPSVAAVAHGEALHSALEAIYREPAILFKDKLVVKSPGVAGYPLHQDYIAWPDFPRSFLTVVVPLDASTRDNGCIEVFPGAHRRGYLSPPDGDFHDLAETAFPPCRSELLELAPGDVALFGCYLPHRSGANRTGTPRRQLYLSYNRRSELGDYRLRHYERYRDWLTRRYGEFGAAGFYFD